YEGIPKTKRHPKSSQASATPVTNGRQVIVSFGSEGLYAYDFDGKLLWKKDLGVLNAGWFFDPDYEWGIGSSPIIYKNMVIVQCDIQRHSFLAAFDTESGKELWKYSGNSEIAIPTPIVGPGVVIITNGYRGVQPIFAIKPGATGDITL